MLTAKELFIQEIKNPLNEISDYYNYKPEHKIPYDETRTWQFSIAIDARASANLKKAAVILTDIFEDLEFQCLVLNNKEKQNVNDISWDGTAVRKDQEFPAEDFRGHEFLVKIHFNSETNQYEKSPEQIKELMLRAWKALQQEGITLAYVTPKAGVQEIPVEGNFVSPYSYSVYNPVSGFQGFIKSSENILSEAESYNPQNLPNPFANIVITQVDLMDYKLEQAILKKERALRISYQNDHLNEAKNSISQLLFRMQQNIKEQQRDLFAELKAMLNTLNQINDWKDKQEYLKSDAVKKYLKWIITNLPKQSDAKLSMTQEIGNFSHFYELACADPLNPKNISKFLAALEALAESQQATAGIVRIYNDFINDKWCNQFVGQLGINQQDLQAMVAATPASMQKLFRRLLHVKQEELALERERQRKTNNYTKEEANHGSQFISVTSNQEEISKPLTHFIRTNDVSQIQVINLSYANLGDKDALIILDIIKNNTNIIDCNLDGNRISDKCLEDIKAAIKNNRREILNDVFLKFYNPLTDYLFVPPTIRAEDVSVFPNKEARKKQTIAIIRREIQVDENTAERYFNDCHAAWLEANKKQLPELINANRQNVSGEILKRINNLNNKVGVFGGETYLFKTPKFKKPLLLAKHVAMMIDYYNKNGGTQGDQAAFIRECHEIAKAVPSKEYADYVLGFTLSRTLFNQRNEDVDKFYLWLKAMHVPDTVLAPQQQLQQDEIVTTGIQNKV